MDLLTQIFIAIGSIIVTGAICFYYDVKFKIERDKAGFGNFDGSLKL